MCSFCRIMHCGTSETACRQAGDTRLTKVIRAGNDAGKCPVAGQKKSCLLFRGGKDNN